MGLSENQREHHACGVEVLSLGFFCTLAIPDGVSGRLPCAEPFAAGYQVSASLCIDCNVLMVSVCFLPAHCCQTQGAGSSWESSVDARGLVGSIPAPRLGGCPALKHRETPKKLRHTQAVLSAYTDWISKHADRIKPFSLNHLNSHVSTLKFKTNIVGRSFSAWQHTRWEKLWASE